MSHAFLASIAKSDHWICNMLQCNTALCGGMMAYRSLPLMPTRFSQGRQVIGFARWTSGEWYSESCICTLLQTVMQELKRMQQEAESLLTCLHLEPRTRLACLASQSQNQVAPPPLGRTHCVGVDLGVGVGPWAVECLHRKLNLP